MKADGSPKAKVTPKRDGTEFSPSRPVDEGFRRWYHSCPCCLGDAYPAIKRALDDEAGAGHGQHPSGTDGPQSGT